MIRISLFSKILFAAFLFVVPQASLAESQFADERSEGQQKAFSQVPFTQVSIHDRFWSPRLENNALHTIPVCIDQIENQTGRMQNFERAGAGSGKHSGIFFDDSDVYKAIEGVAYSLMTKPDAQLERKMDEWIAKIASAQQPDGYLNTYFTLEKPAERWTDMDKHEMYCGGHMLEAAIAYYQATGKDTLLNVSRRFIDHMMLRFGPAGKHWVPGHEEIELALCKLYNLTGERRYLDFAHWLLEERGHGYGVRLDRKWNPKYYQDEVPVKDLQHITGHAVRAMYLFCGMADVASNVEGTGYMKALNSLWYDVTHRHMYVTGGIGVAYRSEGFSVPYDLPNKEAYCETCASIGMVLWNHRMNELCGDAKYADVLERSLYNGVLSGINLAGDRFFYVNPLESDGTHHRQEWYGCACCPSNVCRFIPSIGNYIYGTSRDALWVNLYVGSDVKCRVGRQDVWLEQETRMPWEGSVRLTFKSGMRGQLRLRVPAWSDGMTVSVNGRDVELEVDEHNYVVLKRRWRKGDVVEMKMQQSVFIIAADPHVKNNVGLRSIQRGPLVYCAEGIDNAAYDSISLSSETKFLPEEDAMLGGIVKLSCTEKEKSFTLIPYYAWDNREATPMRVWFPWTGGELKPKSDGWSTLKVEIMKKSRWIDVTPKSQQPSL